MTAPHLEQPEGRIDRHALIGALGDRAGRFSIEVVDRCESTNSLLLQQAGQGAMHRSVVLALEQTAGRGRRGRTWLAPAGGSLAFSLLWRFVPGSPPPLGLSLAVGVAVARSIEQFGGRAIGLKWPNDVLHAGRKLAGVLIELAGGGGALAAVIGIGLNLHLPAGFCVQTGLDATDLDAALPALPPPHAVMARLLVELDTALEDFARDGFDALRDDWRTRCVHMHGTVQLVSETAAPLEGRCLDVDHDGALLLLTEGGVQRVVSGDVSLRRT